jgi:hypothetical protein
MRFIITTVAVLMILGLAAFGVVSAQKMSAAPSQATASDSPVASVSHPVNPVSQVAQTSGKTIAAASAPVRCPALGEGRCVNAGPRGLTRRLMVWPHKPIC